MANPLLGTVFGSLNAVLGSYASRDGFAKQNRYEVVIGLPAGVFIGDAESAGKDALSSSVQQQMAGNTAREISYRCDSISIPGRNLRTVANTNVYGPTHEMVQGLTFAEVQATFYTGSDLAERTFFDNWQKVSYNPNTYNLNYYKEYVGTVDIYQLNEQDERTYGVRLEEVFPKTVEAMAVSHASNNAIQKVNVSLSYRYWRNLIVDADVGSKTLGNDIAEIAKNAVEKQILTRLPQVLRRL